MLQQAIYISLLILITMINNNISSVFSIYGFDYNFQLIISSKA